ncbi:MAG: hypothetical protein ACPLZA_00055 [Thermodesulfovibrio sp.]|jgi:hypothetical protein|uniref:Cell division protein FtsL n=2 Tax=Thermodesulfovibrio TaxID=28261 RepID=A0A2J6WP49_9BACT|nr:MAG: hypothetical protein C0186_01970 [Thermodesulfovibrio aggregans]
MKYFISIVFVLFAIFAILWVRSNVISVEYRLSSLEEKKKALLRENKNLLAQKSSLTSFVRINNAEEHLLVFPDRKKVVYIEGRPENLVKTISFNKKN